MKKEILSRIRDLGLLAVLRGPNPETTIKIVDALVEGGVKGIEVTFTTPDALFIVDKLNKKYGNSIILGMGTLTELDQPELAKRVGAKFLVSPHTEKDLAQAMVSTGLPIMMGALTPSEFVKSYQLGSDVVKLFPGSLGGLSYLKSLRGPFPNIPVMPTGGVSLENLSEWFAAGVFAVGVGSALFPKDWVNEKRFMDISARAEEFCKEVKKAQK